MIINFHSLQLVSPQIMKLLMEFVQTSTDDDTNNDPETWHGVSMVFRNAMKKPMGICQCFLYLLDKEITTS